MLTLPKGLPDVCGLEKKEIVDLLLREEYGYLPEKPHSIRAELLEHDKRFCAGKADLKIYNLICNCPFGEFSFPVRVVIPKNEDPVPAFVHINFSPDVPDKYQPTEEIIDAGYAVISFCYEEVSSDDGDFRDGLAGLIYPDGKRPADGCGKIAIWAWAAMRVLDFALTLDSIDPSRISVTGHSRLGKTALLAGMLDERFYCAISNDSGCSGAAVARDNDGESVKKIVDRFPYWFCENYYKYSDNEDAMPFDQHFLVAANYPHRVYVASAEDDAWACPQNEFLSCVAAGEYYKKQGSVGFNHNGAIPECGKPITGGSIGYHIRHGSHYQSREDWKYYITFIES
ncbi:MAG: hypothetical protein IJD70_07765 [Clostridia bacterium]|nr:hypothetical protein [Clostridia bacterium]